MARNSLDLLCFPLLAVVLALPVSAQNSSPVVTNVVAAQIQGTGQVRVTYDVSDADGDPVTCRLVCSSNGGTTFDLLPVTVSGAINTTFPPGPGKEIMWNAAADFPGRYWTQVVAKVFASDGPALAGEMVLVQPAGNFTMGSTANGDEQPVHTVYLDAFYIDKYEVSNAEYKQFIDAGGYSTQAFWSAQGWAYKISQDWTAPTYWGSGGANSGPGYPGFPVHSVSYYEAEAYAAFAGKRLPTEAEWEKAARGTNAQTYPWGEGITTGRANYSSSWDPYEPYTTPVGFYDGRLHPNPVFQTTNSPGPYGTYDQAGNVLEWVRDWYSGTYYASSPSSNPPGPVSGSSRVLRGGSWTDVTSYLRCAQRITYAPTLRYFSIGFRCARTVP